MFDFIEKSEEAKAVRRMEKRLRKAGISRKKGTLSRFLNNGELLEYGIKMDKLIKYFADKGDEETVQKIKEHQRLCKLTETFLRGKMIKHQLRIQSRGRMFSLNVTSTRFQKRENEQAWKKRMIDTFQENGYREKVNEMNFKNVFLPKNEFNQINDIYQMIAEEKWENHFQLDKRLKKEFLYEKECWEEK